MNVFTPNEIRHKLGEIPSESVWADLVKTDADIALSAAKGVGIIDDPDLNINKARPPVKPATSKVSASRWTPDEPQDEEEI